MLKNALALAIVAVHTAENEPPKVYESPKKSLKHGREVPRRSRAGDALEEATRADKRRNARRCARRSFCGDRCRANL